jgi:hypothetical protein
MFVCFHLGPLHTDTYCAVTRNGTSVVRCRCHLSEYSIQLVKSQARLEDLGDQSTTDSSSAQWTSSGYVELVVHPNSAGERWKTRTYSEF